MAAVLGGAGEVAGAASALRAALALDPDRDITRLDLAQLLLERSSDAGRLEEAADCLAGVSPAGKLDARWIALNTQRQSQGRAAELPAIDVLQQRIDADPADLQARLDLANALVARRDYEPALEQLLAVVERDRTFGDDAGRRLMLSVFDLATDQPQLVSSFRRRLSAALYR
jgi:putative thioredoxin